MRIGLPGAVVSVALLAVATHSYLLDGPASPAVDLTFAVARHGGEDPANVVPAYPFPSLLWTQRPLAFVLAGPFAAAGLLGFRLFVTLVSAAPLPMAAWAGLRLKAKPSILSFAVIPLAFVPPFVRAATNAWTASLAVSFALGAFLAMRPSSRREQTRPFVAAGLALAAAWSHPVGILAPLALLAATAARAVRRKEARLYPLELDHAATAAAGAALLAPLPAAISWIHGSAALVSVWSWAAVGAVALAVAVPVLFAAALRPRVSSVAPGAAVAVLLVASFWLPGLGRSDEPSLDGAVAALGPQPWDSVLLVDVDWRLVPHPFADGARLVGWSYTTVSLPPGDWVHAVEGSGHTVLAKEDRPVNEALRSAYAECAVYEDPRYVVLDGACTPGHGEAFQRAATVH